MKFIYYNANPFNNQISDCFVRSLSKVTGRTWDEVYKEVSDLARKEGLLFSNVQFVEDYLDERYPRECHYSKTIKEFIEEHPKGKYLITMEGHITAVINGIIFDTFNPSNRIMRCAWRVI